MIRDHAWEIVRLRNSIPMLIITDTLRYAFLSVLPLNDIEIDSILLEISPKLLGTAEYRISKITYMNDSFVDNSFPSYLKANTLT